jgi:uncharacterized protein with GYD domain
VRPGLGIDARESARHSGVSAAKATPRSVEPKGDAMATYIVLGKLTEQGIKNVKDMPNRRAARQKSAESFGITLKDGHLTMGQYDVVFMLDAPNDEAVAKFVLSVGMRGNLATETLRAFSDNEADALLSQL